MYILYHFTASAREGIYEQDIIASDSKEKLVDYLLNEFKEDVQQMRFIDEESDSVAYDEFLTEGIIYERINIEGQLEGYGIKEIKTI